MSRCALGHSRKKFLIIANDGCENIVALKYFGVCPWPLTTECVDFSLSVRMQFEFKKGKNGMTTLRIHRASVRCFSRLPDLRGAGYFFLMVGLLAFGYCDSAVARGQNVQTPDIAKFKYAALRAASAPISESAVIGEIIVPRLSLKVLVAEGVSDDVLKRAAGHIPETPLPGEWGNVAVAAHRNTFFRPLQRIHLGDVIALKTADASYLYQVEYTSIVEPTDVQVLQSSGAHTLTLITCFPFNYVGSAPHRFIVRAREVRASTEGISEHEIFSPELRKLISQTKAAPAMRRAHHSKSSLRAARLSAGTL